MLKSVLTAFVFAASATLATAQDANTACKDWVIETGRYQSELGAIELSGPPLQFDGWTAPHSVLTITFPSQSVVLTTAEVSPHVLGDYIITTATHRKRNFQAFGVISEETDGNRLGLVQPFTVEGKPHCFALAVYSK